MTPDGAGVVVHTSLPDATVLASIDAVYAAAFAAPPYGETAADVERFRAQYDRLARERPGFRLAVATRAGAVTGTLLAVTAPPGGFWRDRVATAIGPAATTRWLGEACLEIVTVAVDPTARRRGTASALLAATCADAARAGLRTAALSCWVDAPVAWATYVGLGWTPVTDELRLRPDGPQLGVFARDL